MIVFDDQKIRTHINHRDQERDCGIYNSLYCLDSYRNIEKGRNLSVYEYDIRQRDYDEAAEIERE